MRIKDLNENERPRERLLKYGVNNLSLEELIAIVIRTGIKNMSVKEVSQNLLYEIKDLKNLRINNLLKIKGIGKIKSIELIAAIELGRRVYYEKDTIKKIKLNNAKIIFEHFKYILNDKKQEYFYCIYLDCKKNIISTKTRFRTIRPSTTETINFIICSYFLLYL